MELLLIKALSVIAMVLGLTYIAENISVKLSGLIAGFPTGSIVTYAFFAVEFGTGYVAGATLYNINGLLANLAFCLTYFFSTYYRGRGALGVSLLLSLSVYAAMMLGLSQLPVSIEHTPFTVLPFLVLAIAYLVRLGDERIAQPQKLSLLSFALRLALTVFIFISISVLPHFVAPNYAGIFSSFPIVLLPVMIIIHYNYGAAQVRTVAKSAPLGLPSVVAFSSVVHFSVVPLGAFAGIALALLASVATVLLQTLAINAWLARRARLRAVNLL